MDMLNAYADFIVQGGAAFVVIYAGWRKGVRPFIDSQVGRVLDKLDNVIDERVALALASVEGRLDEGSAQFTSLHQEIGEVKQNVAELREIVRSPMSAEVRIHQGPPEKGDAA